MWLILALGTQSKKKSKERGFTSSNSPLLLLRRGFCSLKKA